MSAIAWKLSSYGTLEAPADWTFIPGGVVSGPALLLPNHPGPIDPFPFLWQQKEYAMSGAATYIFCDLAADRLCGGSESGA